MAKSKKNVIKGQAPDGGWGWFICLGSSLITVLLTDLSLYIIIVKLELLIHVQHKQHKVTESQKKDDIMFNEMRELLLRNLLLQDSYFTKIVIFIFILNTVL